MLGPGGTTCSRAPQVRSRVLATRNSLVSIVTSTRPTILTGDGSCRGATPLLSLHPHRRCCLARHQVAARHFAKSAIRLPWRHRRHRRAADRGGHDQVCRNARDFVMIPRQCCTRRQRPPSRAAKERDELAAAAHSITSSARASSVDASSIPSAFAVLRLITSSYFVGAWT